MKNISPIQDLAEKGVVYATYPADLRAAVERAVESWKQYCALDERLRIQFPYNRESSMGVGYELKKAKGANLDVKEDFHFSPGAKTWIKETARRIKNDTMLRFVNDAELLASMAKSFVVEFGGVLEKEFALKGLENEVRGSGEILFIRFLHYFGNRTPGEEIATPHADKSGFTLHLYESDPGLEYLSPTKQWNQMNVSDGQTAIIPGMRLQYRSKNALKAIYHRVVATEKTAREGRFSVVCFVHFKNTPQYNKEKAGRLQEFQPGFNYEMPFEEFAKLFLL